MGKLVGRLGELRARDVMTRDVIVVREADPLQTAIETLKEHHITGVPVVDAQGRFVGILSMADLVERSLPGTDRIVCLPHGRDGASWDLFERAIVPVMDAHAELVGQRMSRRVVSVPEHLRLVDVARVMCDGHWHRVPVVTNDGNLCGIISTMDVLAALVNAAEEPA